MANSCLKAPFQFSNVEAMHAYIGTNILSKVYLSSSFLTTRECMIDRAKEKERKHRQIQI